jgi:twinkle protein
MTGPELDAGITYAELGINIGRCRGPECKSFCPQCHAGRKNQRDKSLSVNIEDGHWNCHHCKWHSGLGIEGRNRLRDSNGSGSATSGTGLSERTGEPSRESSHPLSTPPSPAPSAKTDYAAPRNLPPELHSWASAWLLSERGIPDHFAEKFSLRASEYSDKDTGEIKQCIHFPYFVNGKHVNTKHRTLPKQFSQERNTVRSLYNIDSAEGAQVIVITEGELDVIACAVAGWEAAVSAPDGAGKGGRTFAAFDEPTCARVLGEARKLIIAVDGDEPGQAYRDALISRFGPERCWVVSFPEGCKDANDVLVRFGVTELDRILAKAKPAPLPGVRPLSVHRDALYEIYEKGFSPGVSTGWPGFDQLYRPVEGELVIVSGYPGHGKTSWMNHLFSNLAHVNDWNIALYSPENGDEGEILGKFVQITADAPYLPGADKRIPREELDTHIDWVGEHFWEVYSEDSDGGGFASLTVPRILELTEPLALKRNIRALTIDPWNECESARPHGMTVEEYISTSLSTMRRWIKRNRVTVFIIIHPRKPDSIKTAEDTAPEPYEAAGAAHRYNKADVFLSVHRVKYGEDAGKTTVHVKKHRREGISGMIGSMEFRYDRRASRFYEEGTIIPAEVGSNPYSLVMPTAREVVAVGQMEMESVPF